MEGGEGRVTLDLPLTDPQPSSHGTPSALPPPPLPSPTHPMHCLSLLPSPGCALSFGRCPHLLTIAKGGGGPVEVGVFPVSALMLVRGRLCWAPSRLISVAVSVQVAPLYAMIISDDDSKCLQPGCGELMRGYVPWVSFSVTLLAPWASVVGVGHYLSVAAVAAVTIITFASLTVPDLSTTQRSVAVVASTIVSGVLAIVRCALAAGWCAWVCPCHCVFVSVVYVLVCMCVCGGGSEREGGGTGAAVR